MLLSIAYFPPIQYFSKISDCREICIESHENYQKQSYRNRFIIASANGQLALSIPVVKGRTPAQNITEVEIDYSTKWQKLHSKSLESAYSRSPFYEFYIDDFKQFWEVQDQFLFDYNLRILRSLLKALDFTTNISFTVSFHPIPVNHQDFRELIHPKIPYQNDGDFLPHPYTQVFSDRYGFLPNLSILDLIFNMGPQAAIYLTETLKKTDC